MGLGGRLSTRDPPSPSIRMLVSLHPSAKYSTHVTHASSPTASVRTSLAHGMFDDERSVIKRPLSESRSMSWNNLRTDTSWTTPTANQLDTRCESVVHLQKLLPPGNTAIERQRSASTLSTLTLPPPSGPAQFALQEPSRFALANTVPPAHDMHFRKSAMPAGSSILVSRRP
jgi:hypothetical protein